MTILVAALLAAGALTPADLDEAMLRGGERYYEGRYAEALPYFDRVAKTASDESLKCEALKLKAVTLFLLKLYAEARETWLSLLETAPESQLDADSFSPDIVAFFAHIKRPEPEAVPPPAPTPALVAAPASISEARPVDPAPTVALTQPLPPPPTRGCGVWLCLVPFGAGQFANSHPLKGGLFAGVQGLTLAGNLGLYWARVSHYDKTGEVSGSNAVVKTQLLAQRILFSVFVASAVGGVVDAFVFP